jgi:hypothetical protein
MNFERQMSVLAYSIIAVAALGSACVDHVDTGLKSCPCAEGYVCCASGVCAADSASCDAATVALSTSVQGSWSGYIENFYRSDAPDAVRIAIAVAADGTLSGQAKFGTGAPPPPPSDPNVPWPPGYTTAVDPTFLEGTSYTARDINWQSRRLKLKLELSEPWQPWCALLPSYPTDFGPPYACQPAGIAYEADGTCWVPGAKEPSNCDKWSVCGLLCECDASGCHASAINAFTISVDIAFDRAKAEGSISVYGGNFNLRLTRDP